MRTRITFFIILILAVILMASILIKNKFLKMESVTEPTVMPATTETIVPTRILPSLRPAYLTAQPTGQGYNCCSSEQVSQGYVCLSRNNCGPAGSQITEYHCVPKGTTYIPCRVL